HRRTVRILEGRDHLVAPAARHAAVQPPDLDAEPRREIRAEQLAPFGELREAQRLGALCHDLLEELLGARELPRTARERGPVTEQVRGMVADLLQAREAGEHEPAALDPFRLLRARDE